MAKEDELYSFIGASLGGGSGLGPGGAGDGYVT